MVTVTRATVSRVEQKLGEGRDQLLVSRYLRLILTRAKNAMDIYDPFAMVQMRGLLSAGISINAAKDFETAQDIYQFIMLGFQNYNFEHRRKYILDQPKETTIPILCRVIDSQECTIEAKQFALIILKSLKDEKAVPNILKLLKESRNFDDLGAEILGNISYKDQELRSQACEVLRNLFGTLPDSIKQSIIGYFAKLDDKKAVPLIIGELQNERIQVRLNAVVALGTLRAEIAIPKLLEKLDPKLESSDRVRETSARALIIINKRTNEILEALGKAIREESDPQIKEEFIYALRILKGGKFTISVLE
ncbi:MAG: HEAT repeat domain-containing protein [Candidatus Micrarchaeota archaeon]